MRVTIRDPQILSKVGPLDLTTYLRTRGWKEEEHSPGRFAIWTLSRDSDIFEILLPLDTTYRDYALRIGDIFQTLERVEERSQLELLADVAPSIAGEAGLQIPDHDPEDSKPQITSRKVTLSLPEDLVAFADTKAAESGMTRSHLIRELLSEFRRREQLTPVSEGYRFYAEEAKEFADSSAVAVAEAIADDRSVK